MATDNVDAIVTHRHIPVGDIRLHVAEAGAGPLVILLHGFPDFWYSWRYQIPALVDAGFRVVAPDMRGYNLSEKPRGVAAYHVRYLTADVAGLIRACGEERAHVVGHDWGAVVAWSFAMRYPEMLRRLAILNVPHPVRMMEGLRTPRQLLKSWYMFFFQLPWLPEASIRMGSYAVLRRLFRTDPARPGAFTEEDIRRYVAALSQPGALPAAIHYYRAFLRIRPREARASLRRVDAPVLVIWGERDRYLGAELADPPLQWVPNARVVRLPGASHWVQHDEPERVCQLLVDFFHPR